MVSQHGLVTQRSSLYSFTAFLPLVASGSRLSCKVFRAGNCLFVPTEKPVAHHVKLLNKNGNTSHSHIVVICCTFLGAARAAPFILSDFYQH